MKGATRRSVLPNPVSSPAPLVSHVLVAEFDIDKGSTLRACHPPGPLPRGYDGGFFANLMLPEGAHHRREDTTVFFLHREGRRLTLGSRRLQVVCL